MNEIKFSKKYQIVSKNTSLFAEIKNNNKITENSIEIKNDYSGSSDKENIIMVQMSQMINNKMNNHIDMYKQWRNNYDIMINHNMNGIMFPQNNIMMNSPPPSSSYWHTFVPVSEWQLYIWQNFNFNNLINEYELKKRIYYSIKNIIKSNNMAYNQFQINKLKDLMNGKELTNEDITKINYNI